MTHEEYWFWLCNIPGIYQESLKKLLGVYASPEEIFSKSAEEIEQKGLLNKRQAVALLESKKDLSGLARLETLAKEGTRFLNPDSPSFPEKLKTIPDPPYCLYVRGALPDPEKPSAGMVGARACSDYGKEMAKRFAGTLAAAGVQIISGLASGIDSLSAKGALAGGGKTFAVLGSGLDVIYPAENISLYYEIIASGGGIISEYPMGTQPVPWQFPLRNRLISGLSDRLLVMEAKERSGTLITVRYALEQGRDIYALPGRITDRTSQGCNQMIADGAGILISPEYLLEEIYREPVMPLISKTYSKEDPNDANGKGQSPDRGRKERSKQKKKKTEITGLREDLKKIFELTGKRPVTAQFIIEKTGENAENVAVSLAELELMGLIEESSKNNYIRIF